VHKQVDAVPLEAQIPDRSCMVWAGTVVSSGSGQAIVTAIGKETAFGGIAQSLSSITPVRSPLERRMDRLGRGLAILAVILAALVFVIGVLQNDSVREMFFFAVAMLVSAIPEGLPAVLTVVLAIGVRRM